MQLGRTAALLGIAAALLGACAADGEPASPAEPLGPYSASAQMRPDLMEVEPATAAPGEALALRFPAETNRGVAFVLEEEIASSWELRYFLVAGSETEGASDWWTPDDAEGRGWTDIGVSGPGPDYIEVPDTATAGNYRVCIEHTIETICTPLEVVD